MEARKVEEVCILWILLFAAWDLNWDYAAWLQQESLREQETLIPQEQAAREKVAELKSAMNSEKSQGDVLKAVLRAKENNQIEGIYGRMGDLGAIDGKCIGLISRINVLLSFDISDRYFLSVVGDLEF